LAYEGRFSTRSAEKRNKGPSDLLISLWFSPWGREAARCVGNGTGQKLIPGETLTSVGFSLIYPAEVKPIRNICPGRKKLWEERIFPKVLVNRQ